MGFEYVSPFFFRSPSRSYSHLPNLPLPLLPALSVLKTRGTKPMATRQQQHMHVHMDSRPCGFTVYLHPRHTPRVDQGQHLPRFLRAQPVVGMRVILGPSFLSFFLYCRPTTTLAPPPERHPRAPIETCQKPKQLRSRKVSMNTAICTPTFSTPVGGKVGSTCDIMG